MHDVVVIGAGPAGSAAAYHASRRGLRVLIVDRTPFPRPKTCGDGLTPRALAAMHRMGISEVPGWPIHGVSVIHLPSGERRFDDFRNHGAPHAGQVIARETLDRMLLDRARGAGAEFRVARVREVRRAGAHVRGILLDRGIEIPVETVVAAAGAGVHATLLGAAASGRRRIWGLAGRTYLTVRGHVGDDFEFYIPVVHNGRLLMGYGWVFPAGPGRINIGLGVSRTAATGALPLRRLIQAFIEQRAESDPRLRGAMQCAPIESASIPFGPIVPAVSGLLPAGDLAGLPGVFSGEGISQALESGELAAEAIGLGSGDVTGAYRRLLADRFPRHFSLNRSLDAMHSRPWFALGRGWDLLTAGHDTAGGSLWSVIWDTPHEPEHRRAPLSPPLRSAIDTIRGDIIRAGRHLRPLLAELLTSLLDNPRCAFGWYTAFAAAVRATLFPFDPDLLNHSRAPLVILETLGLAAALHEDMVPPERPGHADGTWGRNTLSLVLADCLTANALQQLYGLDAAWMRRLGGAARVALRTAARARSSGRDSSTEAQRAQEALFVAASLAATGEDHTAALPPLVRSVARCLSAARSGTEASPQDLAAGRSATGPLLIVVQCLVPMAEPVADRRHDALIAAKALI